MNGSRPNTRTLPAAGRRHDNAEAIDHDTVVKAFLLVVVDAHARLDFEAVEHLEADLTERGEAGRLEVLRVARGQAFEHRGIELRDHLRVVVRVHAPKQRHVHDARVECIERFPERSRR